MFGINSTLSLMLDLWALNWILAIMCWSNDIATIWNSWRLWQSGSMIDWGVEVCEFLGVVLELFDVGCEKRLPLIDSHWGNKGLDSVDLGCLLVTGFLLRGSRLEFFKFKVLFILQGFRIRVFGYNRVLDENWLGLFGLFFLNHDFSNQTSEIN